MKAYALHVLISAPKTCEKSFILSLVWDFAIFHIFSFCRSNLLKFGRCLENDSEVSIKYSKVFEESLVKIGQYKAELSPRIWLSI